MKRKNKNMTLGDFSALLSVFLIVFIVIYAEGSYDIWDAILGVMTLLSLWKFRSEIKKRQLWLNIGLIAFAISIMILIRFIDSLISVLMGGNFIVSEIKNNYERNCPNFEKIFDFDFLIFLPVFLFSILVLKLIKKSKK